MKTNILLILASFTVTLTLGCTAAIKSASASAYTKYDGNWLSNCFPVGGGNYAKYYVEINEGVQALAMLAFGASSDCSSSYTLLNTYDFGPLDAPEVAFQLSPATVADIPDTIDAVRGTALSENYDTQLFFMGISEDGTQFSGLTGNSTHFECTEWSACVSEHAILEDYALSPFVSPSGLNPVDYSFFALEPVDGLPAN